MKKHPGRVEDYTTPFLVASFLVVLIGLCTLWATYNYAVAITFACFVYIGLGRLPVKD